MLGRYYYVNLKENLEEFIDSVRNSHGFVIFRLSVRNIKIDGFKVVGLNYINVPERLRGNGVGSFLLSKLVKWADENNVFLVLSPGSRNMFGLINFYSRYDFILATDSIEGIVEKPPYLMYRVPNN